MKLPFTLKKKTSARFDLNNALGNISGKNIILLLLEPTYAEDIEIFTHQLERALYVENSER